MIDKLVDHRFRVPGTVEDVLGDNGGKVEDENGQHDEGTNESPCGLPEDIRLVSDHKYQVVIEPVHKQETQSFMADFSELYLNSKVINPSSNHCENIRELLIHDQTAYCKYVFFNLSMSYN